jgi:hypothetical protein
VKNDERINKALLLLNVFAHAYNNFKFCQGLLTQHARAKFDDDALSVCALSAMSHLRRFCKSSSLPRAAKLSFVCALQLRAL